MCIKKCGARTLLYGYIVYCRYTERGYYRYYYYYYRCVFYSVCTQKIKKKIKKRCNLNEWDDDDN